MSIKIQQKTILPHEGVEVLLNTNKQIAITGPGHEITNINVEELEATAQTVMFTTTETSSSATIAVPTTWGQRQGILVVLGKSQECLRYYGSDIAAKGGDISSAPVWYRSKRPILGVTIKGVLAVLQTASEWIVLMSDAVTCREIAVHPITTSTTPPSSKITAIQTALSEMSRGSATFIAATTDSSSLSSKKNAAPTQAKIEIAAFSITSASMTLINVCSIAKTFLTTNHLAINAEAGLIAFPTYNNESKTSIGLTTVSVLNGSDARHLSCALEETAKKILLITAISNKRWLLLSSPLVASDGANAVAFVISSDASSFFSEEILIGNNTNSSTNKIEKRLLAIALPSGRSAIIISGHEIHVIKIPTGTRAPANPAEAEASTSLSKSTLAARLKMASSAKAAAPTISSSRLSRWDILVDASAADVYNLIDVDADCNENTDDIIANAVADSLIKLNDLPSLVASSLAQLPFAEWHHAAKNVKNVHTALSAAHLLFLSALKRGAITTTTIASRAFDALYSLTAEDESSAAVAREIRQCLQQLGVWSSEQMGKQIGLVTAHCTRKSPAIKQAMFVPHQPFAVSVKRHADIESREYTTEAPLIQGTKR